MKKSSINRRIPISQSYKRNEKCTIEINTTYLASVVNNREVCFWAELWDLELRMFSVFFDDFVYIRFVCGFREPAFFIQQSKQTHGLKIKHAATEHDALNPGVSTIY